MTKEAWVPTKQSATLTLVTTSLIVPARGRALKATPGLEKYFTQYLPPTSRQPPSIDFFPPSVFEHTLSAFSEAQEKDNEWNTKGLDSGVNPEEYKRKKGQGIQTRMANYLRPVVLSDMGKATSDKSKDSLADLLDNFGIFLSFVQSYVLMRVPRQNISAHSLHS